MRNQGIVPNMDLQEKAALIRHYYKLTDKKPAKPFEMTSKMPKELNCPAVDLSQEEYLAPEYLEWRRQNGDDKLGRLLHVISKHDMAAGIEFLLKHPLALDLNNKEMKILLARPKKVVALYEKIID